MKKRVCITLLSVLLAGCASMNRGAGSAKSERIVHSVFFTLKHEAGSPEEAAFFAKAERLAAIPSVQNLQVLKENVSEVGEALPNHAQYNGSTLFLRGDKSEYIGNQDESIIKSHFPNSEIKTIENAGHWLHAENPTDFYQNVMHFLKA